MSAGRAPAVGSHRALVSPHVGSDAGVRCPGTTIPCGVGTAPPILSCRRARRARRQHETLVLALQEGILRSAQAAPRGRCLGAYRILPYITPGEARAQLWCAARALRQRQTHMLRGCKDPPPNYHAGQPRGGRA